MCLLFFPYCHQPPSITLLPFPATTDSAATVATFLLFPLPQSHLCHNTSVVVAPSSAITTPSSAVVTPSSAIISSPLHPPLLSSIVPQLTVLAAFPCWSSLSLNCCSTRLSSLPSSFPCSSQ
ncbi:hypothetical protein GW17_00052462 [Ensete ventricosum]|nr:hypothetical protein GW17_00052462 [Ensete ventricosum]